MRQTQGSIICPRCGKLISVNEEKCPFCGAWRPGLYGWAPAMQKLIGRRLDLVSLIVSACVVLYVVALALEPQAIFRFTGLFSILSPGSRALWQLGMTGRLAWEQGWWWTILTAIYLHGSLIHIFFNVLWIRQLGPPVTEAYGPARAFVLFNVAGAVGFVISNLMSGAASIGASGAIFGMLAALIVYGRRIGHTLMTRQLVQWALIMFVLGFVMPSVNNWAHAGGFAAGWGVATLLPTVDQRREGNGVVALALLTLLGVVAGIALSFVNVTSILLRQG